jgi:hypothetical protein
LCLEDIFLLIMKSFAFLFVGATALVSQATAHYIFEKFGYAGVQYPVYQYVRMNTNYNSPIINLTSFDLRCNQGGENGTDTATITVQAGQPFSLTTDVAVYHDGPFSLYMAKAPTGTSAANFDGSGQVWFKILDLGPTFNSDGSVSWPLYQTYNYTIPPNLPNGDYLLRPQQLGIHNPYPAGIPQFYIECVQLTVTGGGTGTPGPLVSIPGYIDGTEPGYVVNIYTDFTNYTIPGPAVWSGQGNIGTAVEHDTTTLLTMPSTSVVVATQPTTSTAKASTTATTKATTTATTKATTTSTTKASTTSTTPVATATGAVVAEYGQCGGTGWTGGTVCAAGTTCTYSSAYYSQCLA